MKLLHLGSPSDQLRTCEHTRIIEGAYLDEDRTRRPFGMCRQVNSTSGAELSCRRSGKVLLVEGMRSALGKLERLSVDRHKEISGPARYLLARPTEAQPVEALRSFALVADFTTVAAACYYSHSTRLLPNVRAQRG
jgi:hypothetical protein